MPQYLMSVWHDEEYVVDFTAEMQRVGPQVGAFNEELEKAGAWVFGAGLQPASSATVLRPAGPETSCIRGGRSLGLVLATMPQPAASLAPGAMGS